MHCTHLNMLLPGHGDLCIGEDFVVVLGRVRVFVLSKRSEVLTVSIATPSKLGYFMNPFQELSGWNASWITSSREPYNPVR